MNKIFFVLTSMLMILEFPNIAISSTRVGNGGGALVCKNPNGDTTVTLLDLYEATERYGLKLSQLTGTVDQQMAAIYGKIFKTTIIDFGFGDVVKTIADDFKTNVKFIPADRKLQLIDDANYLMLPINCERQQLAIFDDLGNIYIDTNLYNKLDNTNKAALFIHEAIYYLQKDSNKMDVHLDDINSDTVRKSVAYLFSDTILENVRSPEAMTGVFCKTKDNEIHQFHKFYAYLKDNKIRIEFVRISNEIMISNTSIEWDLEWDLRNSLDGDTAFASPKSIMQPDPLSNEEDSNHVSMKFAKATSVGESLLSRIKGIRILTINNSGDLGLAEVECKSAVGG